MNFIFGIHWLIFYITWKIHIPICKQPCELSKEILSWLTRVLYSLQYLADVEEHLGESISVIQSHFKVPTSEFDGKVSYGAKRGRKGTFHRTFVLFRFEACGVMWCDVMWCDVTWRDVTWCDVMWCDVMLYLTLIAIVIGFRDQHIFV